MTKEKDTGNDGIAEEMLPVGNNTLQVSLTTETPEDTPTFWQSYKHIIIPFAIIATIITTATAALAVYFSKDTDPEPAAPSPTSGDGYPVGNCTFYEEYVARNNTAQQLLQGVVCKATTVLDLSGRSIGALAAAALAPAIQQLSKLTSINLSNNNIGDSSAVILGKSLELLPQLGSVNLLNNNLSPTVCTTFQEKIHINRPLAVVQCASSLAPPSQAPVPLPPTTMVPIAPNTQVPPSQNPTAAPNPSAPPSQTPVPTYPPLPDLSNNNYPVGDCPFYDAYVANHTIIQQALLGVVCNVTTQLNITTSYRYLIINELSPAIQQLVQLHHLNISGNDIATWRIADGLRNFSTALQHLTQLEVVDLSDNLIGHHSSQDLQTLGAALQKLTLLKKLYIRQNSIGSYDASTPDFAAALQQLTQLLVLDLSNTGLNKASEITALIPAFQQLTQLEELDFSQNYIGDWGDTGGVTALRELLERVPQLISLNLANINLGDHEEDMPILVTALQLMTLLRTLDLSGNSIGFNANDTAVLTSALQPLRELEVVDLSNNQISLAGCTSLTDAVHADNPDAIVSC